MTPLLRELACYFPIMCLCWSECLLPKCINFTCFYVMLISRVAVIFLMHPLQLLEFKRFVFLEIRLALSNSGSVFGAITKGPLKCSSLVN